MLQAFTHWADAGKGLALSALLLGAATPASAQKAYGLAATYGAGITYSLVTFQVTAPGTFTATVPITGLASGQALVGLDTRPSTGELFGLGYNSTSSQAQVYTLNPSTGALAAVGSALTLALGSSPNRIGFDFNPTVDRIRVTAGNGANYRLNPATGGLAATDGTLAYASTDPNASQTPSVGSSAYTNSYGGSTVTTLYNLDEATSRLVTQDPPNSGTLNTVGPLGVSVGDAALQVSDLDIYYNPTTVQNVAFLSVATISLTTLRVSSQLYTVNLGTGATTSLGPLGGIGSAGITDIALASATGVVTASRPAELATDFALFPNPLASGTSLSFGLPRAARVELLVTDALGRPVDAVDAGLLPAGAHTVRWNRGNQAAGLYFFCLRCDGQPAGTRSAALTQ